MDSFPFATFGLASLCAAGAFVLYILNRNGGIEPFSLFKVLNVDVSISTGKPIIILTDMVISSVIGGGVVFGLVSPSTPAQAIAAGLAMTGIFSAQGKSL